MPTDHSPLFQSFHGSVILKPFLGPYCSHSPWISLDWGRCRCSAWEGRCCTQWSRAGMIPARFCRIPASWSKLSWRASWNRCERGRKSLQPQWLEPLWSEYFSAGCFLGGNVRSCTECRASARVAASRAGRRRLWQLFGVCVCVLSLFWV